MLALPETTSRAARHVRRRIDHATYLEPDVDIEELASPKYLMRYHLMANGRYG